MIATRVGDSNFASPFPQTCPLSAPVGLLRSWARKRRQTKLLTRDEARRLAANFAKPELVEAEAVKPATGRLAPSLAAEKVSSVADGAQRMDQAIFPERNDFFL
jgi:hypothetical protein